MDKKLAAERGYVAEAAPPAARRLRVAASLLLSGLALSASAWALYGLAAASSPSSSLAVFFVAPGAADAQGRPAPSEFEAEQMLDRMVSRDNIRENLRYFTSVAHMAGTPANKEQAVWAVNKIRKNGIPDVRLVRYWPLLSFPVDRSLDIMDATSGSSMYSFPLLEEILSEDPTSRFQNSTPTFLGYAANGLVEAPVVFVNYGLPQDFERLRQMGIDVAGKIVLVKYGQNFRGLKVKAAQLNNAAAVLIYSDPIDDGFVRGPVYPNGPFRPSTAVQRGSVNFISSYTGDPLTPGYAATYDAPRIDREQSNLPKIPALPLSYGDAARILEQMQGPVIPEWQGGLPLNYRLGPGPKLRLKVENKFEITEIQNVVMRIPGSEEPDRYVILGNHRDAWVFGAVDPNSGTSIAIELTRIFGELLKSGWRPRRTIILCLWDAEEPGIIGSTEWAEDNEDMLDGTAIAYLNVDTAASGPLVSSSASPSLFRLIKEVAKTVADPLDPTKSLFDTWKGRDSKDEPRIGALGSGSDYSPFLQHLGISSIDFSFGGNYSVYHSNYDSFHWQEVYGDPTWAAHEAAARLWGKMALRLADSEILPFDQRDYATEMRTRLEPLARSGMERDPSGASKYELVSNAINVYEAAASQVLVQIAEAVAQPRGSDRRLAMMRDINDRLAFVERQFIDPKGLPSREWYKHVVFAPGLWEGYGAVVFPGLAEAVDANDWEAADAAAKSIANALNSAAAFLRSGRV